MLPPDVTPDTTRALAAVLAPVGRLDRVERLTGGMFATTYRAHLADGRRVVVKTAPTATDRLLTYERDLLRTEGAVYRLAAGHPDLLMPTVLLEDHTRAVLPTDVLVVTHLDGAPLVDAALPPSAQEVVLRGLGAFMARLHGLSGERFGYLDPGTPLCGATWPVAFGRMVEALLADADRWSVALPSGRIRSVLQRYEPALAQVRRPALVHTDLWSGNLFVDTGSGELIGVIDAERALWGDPLLELAGADQMGRGPVPEPLLAGYSQAGGAMPLETSAGQARLLLYRLYLSLVILVEVEPRGYTGDWVGPHRRTAQGNLMAALNALEDADGRG